MASSTADAATMNVSAPAQRAVMVHHTFDFPTKDMDQSLQDVPVPTKVLVNGWEKALSPRVLTGAALKAVIGITENQELRAKIRFCILHTERFQMGSTCLKMGHAETIELVTTGSFISTHSRARHLEMEGIEFNSRMSNLATAAVNTAQRRNPLFQRSKDESSDPQPVPSREAKAPRGELKAFPPNDFRQCSHARQVIDSAQWTPTASVTP
ncbi:hypothetical protein BJ508DRAFT_379134 [Ascobolus immersus RN42]|uniref:Uncharacterized protein n=1 Tax=Ascobolus immersus RN42 TaxID=1160509 RepID=A0A3N4HUR9_ASCIM|nr:hypothetical protein BJ508DRAFT_379134 [Ascobolus immersus RN42]